MRPDYERKAARKNKLRMRYRARLKDEIARTLEKLAMLREIEAEERIREPGVA